MEELNELSLYGILKKLGYKNPYNFTYITEVGEIWAIGKKWKKEVAPLIWTTKPIS